jgi:hypothetical protein
MSNRRKADLDAKVLAVLECTAGKLGPIVGDDFVWDTKPVDDGFDELDHEFLVDLDHRGCF